MTGHSARLSLLGAATSLFFWSMFPSPAPAADFAVGTIPFSVAMGDFNGDGKPDLAVANFDSNTVSVLLGNGDGTFRAPLTVGVGNGPTSVAVGDFNGDGKLDLAVADFNSNTVSALLGNGAGTFRPPLASDARAARPL